MLLTAGFTSRFNADPLHGPMISLPLATFFFVKSPAADHDRPRLRHRGGADARWCSLLFIDRPAHRRTRRPGDLSKRQQQRARGTHPERDLGASRRASSSAQPPGSAGDEPELIPGLASTANPTQPESAADPTLMAVPRENVLMTRRTSPSCIAR